jgi:hypothetical protein
VLVEANIAFTVKEARLAVVTSATLEALVTPVISGRKLISLAWLVAWLAMVSSLLQEASARPATARINRFFFIM